MVEKLFFMIMQIYILMKILKNIRNIYTDKPVGEVDRYNINPSRRIR